MGRLDGKVALISGGARGQGATEAKLFAREGAKVVLGDIRDAEGKQIETEIRAAGGEATYIHLDVTRDADWVEAVGTAMNRYGKLDILVNNAGIVLWKRLEETSEAEWEHLMAVNAKGVFLGTKHAIPAMRRAGGGSIVNISSTAGLRGSPGLAAYIAMYAASPGLPRRPAVDEIFTMEPPPARRIAGMACLVPRNTPFALTAMMCSHSASLVSSRR